MLLMNYMPLLSKNQSVKVNKGDISVPYLLYKGMPGTALYKMGYYELQYITTKNSRIEFAIDITKKVEKLQEIMLPMLSETLVLIKDVKNIKILKQGRAIEYTKPEYLDMEVKELYCKEGNVYIEI